MRNQAVTPKRRTRRRSVKSASSVNLRQRGSASLRWVLRAIPTVLYLSVLILSAWLLYYSIVSPYFAVRQVVVTGGRLLDINQASDSSETLGRNVLLARSDLIEQSVRKISVVRDVRATTELPGRVGVEVVERTPLVQWQAREGSFLVDREGVVFSREAPPEGVILVKEMDGPPMDVGSRVDTGVLSAIGTLQVALPEKAGLRPSWFDYSRSSGIAVPVQGGPRVVFGDATDLDSKLGSLAAIREHLDTAKAKADIIDLRFKDRPVYVLSPSAPAGKQGPTR